jgi:hypothetical protein
MKQCGQRCINCHEHFKQLRQYITQIIISGHFAKDAPDFDTNQIVDCEHENFTELHKFEKTIDENHIFRAVKEKMHYVYAIDKNKRLVFLRAFRNFNDYKRFLSENNAILKIINNN